MLVTATLALAGSGLWLRRRRVVGLALCILALALVAPHLRSGTELVRARNALTLGQDLTEQDLAWSPAARPADYRTEAVAASPYFSDVARSLRLELLDDDWARALAISRHLLGSAVPLNGGAIQRDLRTTHLRIVQQGDGYCGDFVRVFTAIAQAAGLSVRPWAFSFDGFGGHGHIWVEVWLRERQAWALVDVFQNYYYALADGLPVSALGLRSALRSAHASPQLLRLDERVPPGWAVQSRALGYLKKGLHEWYVPWGNNVQTVDASASVRLAGAASRALAGAAAIAVGLQPAVRVLAEPANLAQRQALRAVRSRLQAAAAMALAGAVLLLWPAAGRRRRPQAQTATSAALAAAPGPGVEGLPGVLVYSNLFPSEAQPGAGLFVRERMFRLRQHLPLTVVSPQPWFPGQGLIRRLRPGYRPATARYEVQQGVGVHFPRFLALPGLLRGLDGLSMALCTWPLIKRLRDRQGIGLLDAHFAYPSGYAAVRLGHWLKLPACITLRGTEVRQMATPGLRQRVLDAVRGATRVIAVSDSLRQVMVNAGVPASKIEVVGNGVDLSCFKRQDRTAARRQLGLAAEAKVLVSVGGLVERKGFHRVIEELPALVQPYPGLRYLVVGGPSPEGNMEPALRSLVTRLGLQDHVIFTGPLAPDALAVPLSAADVFVLATSNEGWANVFLEAMACGLPVVTTRVGGNAEVVCRPELGSLVALGDGPALREALLDALQRPWDRERIVAYAAGNSWDNRVSAVLGVFRHALAERVA